jgi:hypothetical protein
MIGTITSVNVKRGYGFITANCQEFHFRFEDAPALILIQSGRLVEFTPGLPELRGERRQRSRSGRYEEIQTSQGRQRPTMKFPTPLTPRQGRFLSHS